MCYLKNIIQEQEKTNLEQKENLELNKILTFKIKELDKNFELKMLLTTTIIDLKKMIRNIRGLEESLEIQLKFKEVMLEDAKKL